MRLRRHAWSRDVGVHMIISSIRNGISCMFVEISCFERVSISSNPQRTCRNSWQCLIVVGLILLISSETRRTTSVFPPDVAEITSFPVVSWIFLLWIIKELTQVLPDKNSARAYMARGKFSRTLHYKFWNTWFLCLGIRVLCRRSFSTSSSHQVVLVN